MNEPTGPPEEAPDLAPPIDVRVGEDTAASILAGETPTPSATDAVTRSGRDTDDRTEATPDVMGGTGGEQAGGAG